jgi:hypothetical protein
VRAGEGDERPRSRRLPTGCRYSWEWEPGSVTLHAEIEEILRDQRNKWMTPAKLAGEVNSRAGIVEATDLTCLVRRLRSGKSSMSRYLNVAPGERVYKFDCKEAGR